MGGEIRGIFCFEKNFLSENAALECFLVIQLCQIERLQNDVVQEK
jgi:hypothetical protein